MKVSTANFDDLRIVKARGIHSYVFEIRCTDAGGVEHVLAAYERAEIAKKRVAGFNHLSIDARKCAVALDAMLDLMMRIQTSSDEQGTSCYATKAHMRAWAGEACLIVQDVLEVLWDRPSESEQ